MYTLLSKRLDKFWYDDGNFEKEEYSSDDECQGVSELQVCLANAHSLIEEPKTKPEAVLDEELSLERRSKKKDLCKRCFWFGVLLSILDSA